LRSAKGINFTEVFIGEQFYKTLIGRN